MALRILRVRSASGGSTPGHLFNASPPPTSRCSQSLPDRSPCLTNRLISSASVRSYFTATQAAAALRPFYFAVHPDLFGLYPEMYKTNEQSLKTLNGYIDGLYTGRSPIGASINRSINGQQPKPITLKFYVRDRRQKQKRDADKTATAIAAAIKSVQLNLRERDPCAAVRTILESCDLSTEHLPPPVQLPWRNGMVESDMRRDTTIDQTASDEELIRFWSSKKKKPTVEIGGLKNWLSRMISQAERLRAEYEALEMDVKKKVDEIKIETGLTDIDFNLSWALNHCRSCLQLFRRMVSSGNVQVVNLKGWVLRFARHGTYISLDRSIILGVDDLPNIWMALINNMNHHHAYYGDLPKLENRLSEILGKGTISGPSDTPVHEYRHRLIILTNRLSAIDQRLFGADIDARRLRFVIENDACGLVITESGRISVPYTVSSDALCDFLQHYSRSALDLMENYKLMQDELKELRRRCLEKWRLESIEWGESGNLNQNALKCCFERLLILAHADDQQVQELKSILKGHRLHIGPQESYVLLPDGRLSIPCDWRL